MNRKQKIVLWIGIIVAVIMGLFPPWIMEVARGGGNFRTLPKYSFILTMPYSDAESTLSLHSIDTSKLVIQWCIVGFITTGFIFTFTNKKPKDDQSKATAS